MECWLSHSSNKLQINNVTKENEEQNNFYSIIETHGSPCWGLLQILYLYCSHACQPEKIVDNIPSVYEITIAHHGKPAGWTAVKQDMISVRLRGYEIDIIDRMRFDHRNGFSILIGSIGNVTEPWISTNRPQVTDIRLWQFLQPWHRRWYEYEILIDHVCTDNIHYMT